MKRPCTRRPLGALLLAIMLHGCGGSDPALPAGPAGWSQTLAIAPWATRDAGASVVHMGEMWLLGGWNFVNEKSYVLTDAWASRDGVTWRRINPPMSHGMYPMAASFNGRLLYMGGMLDSRLPSESLSGEIWTSPDGSSWTREVRAAAWEPRIGSTLTVHANQLWLLGGKVSNSGLAQDRRREVWQSGDGVSWSRVTENAPWEARAFHCAVAHRGRLWILGGGDWDARIGLSDVWSTEDGRTWERHPDAPWEGRIWHTCLSFGGRIWMIGGRLFDPIRTVDEIWSTEDGRDWRQEPDNIRPGPRHAAYSAVHENRMWIMGGSAHGFLQPDIWQYNPK